MARFCILRIELSGSNYEFNFQNIVKLEHYRITTPHLKKETCTFFHLTPNSRLTDYLIKESNFSEHEVSRIQIQQE